MGVMLYARSSERVGPPAQLKTIFSVVDFPQVRRLAWTHRVSLWRFRAVKAYPRRYVCFSRQPEAVALLHTLTNIVNGADA